jgi:hypothetical protein
MKMYFKKGTLYFLTIVLSICIFLISISSCKKSDIPVVTIFPANTEWVGTLNGNGFQYRPPCSLQFNKDNTFTMYAIFVFFSDGKETFKDSIAGTIEKIDTLPDYRIRITTSIVTSFNGVVTKYIYISDQQKIVGANADNTLETFQLVIFPKLVSVEGTWRGIPWKGGFAYPDVSDTKFEPDRDGKAITLAIKNGKAVQESAEPTSDVLKLPYKQIGARLYFSGWSDINPSPGYGGWTIPYFGVLLPPGNKMMVDSRTDKTRLPNYIYTNEPYGPNGATPTITRLP